MEQHELSPAAGSRKDRKRVGRGDGSGNGSYSGRGCKGQKSRSGYRIRPGFEGGQLPIIKRLPRKRGFTNLFRKEYSIVRLDALNIFEANSEVTPEVLLNAGVVKSLKLPIKILSDGDLKHSLTVKADKFSAAAKTKLEAAGGKAMEVNHG
ncbi:MAG: 50S ribosomal protein L15 [Chloroflexota bacterium]